MNVIHAAHRFTQERERRKHGRQRQPTIRITHLWCRHCWTRPEECDGQSCECGRVVAVPPLIAHYAADDSHGVMGPVFEPGVTAQCGYCLGLGADTGRGEVRCVECGGFIAARGRR